MQGKETLSYEAVTEIRNNMNTIADRINEQLEEAKRIIAACESEGIFVTDKGSVAMQEEFSRLAASFAPFVEKIKSYSDFLTNELNVTYSQTDVDLSNVWKNVAEAFNSAINN